MAKNRRLVRSYTVIRRRDPRTGRYVARGGKRERYTFHVMPSGRRVVEEVLAPRTIVKTTERGVIEEAGPTQGLIDSALFKTNVTTKLKGSKEVLVDIRAKDSRDKAKRIHLSLKGDVDSDRLVATILDALRRRNLRTSYDIQQVNWQKARFAPGRFGKTLSSKRRVVHDVQITVRVKK